MKRSTSPSTGTNSSRSAKHRSASMPHEPTRRCRWVSVGVFRSVKSRASSAMVAIARPWYGGLRPDLLTQPEQTGQVIDVGLEVGHRHHDIGHAGQFGALLGLPL